MITLADALAKGHGTWRSFTCTVHDDSSPSARVNVRTGYWVCMSCGAKGRVDGLVIEPDKEMQSVLELLDRPALRHYPESWLAMYKATVADYWLTRFSREACEACEFGWDPIKEKPCYPVRDTTGGVLGVVRRSMDGGPKYRYPVGVETSRLLFGLHRAEPRDLLVIVEGAPNVAAAYDAGYTAVGSYGSRLYPAQAELIAGLSPSRVVIAYDEDRAGRDGGAAAQDLLCSYGVWTVRARWDGEDYNDLADMPPVKRERILKKALALSALS